MKNNKLHSRLIQIPWVFYPFSVLKEIVVENPFQHIQGVLSKVNQYITIFVNRL